MIFFAALALDPNDHTRSGGDFVSKTEVILMLRLVVAFAVLVAGRAQAATQVSHPEELTARLGLESYLPAPGLSRLKIAVLANGFGDFAQRPEEYLPPHAQLVDAYPEDWVQARRLSPGVVGNPLSLDRHGLSMAQIVWASLGQPAYGPQFLLLNANGLTQFRRAVQWAIEQQVDVIQYSENWEYGGNFDGRGFINAEVTRATQAGILWVNAAGNYGGQVYDGPIHQTETLRFENPFDDNRVRFTVSWNDFQDIEEYQTPLDLDVEIWDSVGRVVARGERAQFPLRSHPHREHTLHARELFSATLDRGTYRVHLVHRAGTFDESRRVRIWMTSERPETQVVFLDHTPQREIMIPGDHPEVITVGDVSQQSARGPTMDGRSKPDLVIPDSRVGFSSGLMTAGTSNSAAFFAAIVLAMKAHDPSLTRASLLAMRQTGLSCLYPVDRSRIAESIWTRLESETGRTRVQMPVGIARDGRLTVLLPEPPWTLPAFSSAAGSISSGSGYHFLLNASGQVWWGPRARIAGPALPLDWVELIQQGNGFAVCESAQAGVWVTPIRR